MAAACYIPITMGEGGGRGGGDGRHLFRINHSVTDSSKGESMG